MISDDGMVAGDPYKVGLYNANLVGYKNLVTFGETYLKVWWDEEEGKVKYKKRAREFFKKGHTDATS
jgi:hypothetical protein